MGCDRGGPERRAGPGAAQLRIVLKVRWEGRVGDAPAAIVPLPGEGARRVGDPEGTLPKPAVTKHEAASLEEAAAIAGFTPPAPSDPAATPAGYEVTVLTTPGLAESRIVTVRYYYKGQIYTLTAQAGFAADEAGQ